MRRGPEKARVRGAADLEDEFALARYRERQSAGTTTAVPHDDVRARLGLDEHA